VKQKTVTHWLMASILAWSTLTPAWAERLPALGESPVWSDEQEQLIGQRARASLYANQRVSADPFIADYVNKVWLTLHEIAQISGALPADLAADLLAPPLVIKDRSINAFAMPGGLVGVHLGLLASSDSADALAAVLAHEMSHITQRHIHRLVESQSRLAPIAMAVLLASVVIAADTKASDNRSQVAQAAAMGTQAAMVQGGINFTRGMEQEADRVGWQIYVNAGYSPAGFTAMFKQLEQSARLNDDGSSAYLRTHPLSRERVAEAMARQAMQPQTPTSRHPALSALAPWVQMRAQVVASQRSEEWLQWRDAARGHESMASPTSALVNYRAVVSAMRLGERSWAWQQLQALANRADLAPAVMALLNTDWLELSLHSDVPKPDAAELQRRIEQGLRSDWLGEWMAAARWKIAQGQTSSVVGTLQSKLVNHPMDPELWALLAQAREAQGQTLRAMRARAEVQFAQGNVAGALDHILAAKAWSAAHPQVDPIEAQVVLTRERIFRQTLARCAADQPDAC